MDDTLAALDAQIAKIRTEMEADPRYKALQHLEAARDLLRGGPVPSPKPSTQEQPAEAPQRRRPSSSAEREALFAQIDQYLEGRAEPTKTAEIFEYLTLAGVDIPGKDPKNNLSAIIFNSGRYQSHGRRGWTLPNQGNQVQDHGLMAALMEEPM